SNWIMMDVLAWLNEHGADIGDFPLAPAALAEVIGLVEEGTVTRGTGRKLLWRVAESGLRAHEIVEAEGLARVSDDAQLEAWVDAALAAHPDEAARLGAGEQKLLGFFIGEVMGRSSGKADPKKVREVLQGRVQRLD
ncbi:MAG TPA: GatB/YqeY domain-containing protein, partial [Longimicrobiales bacterium]|nr:GatB/YqeY domain-containing protein [Longimicrobiales bacterium]